MDTKMQNIPDTSLPRSPHASQVVQVHQDWFKIDQVESRIPLYWQDCRDKTHQPTKCVCMQESRYVSPDTHTHTHARTHPHTLQTVTFPSVAMR